MRQKAAVKNYQGLLQSTSKCERSLLQSASSIKVTGCYYKVSQVLQSVTVITRSDVTILHLFPSILTEEQSFIDNIIKIKYLISVTLLA